VCNIIHETCEAICEVLKPEHLKSLSTMADWRKISEDFETQWNFPHCVGAIDGKHVEIQAPSLTGSEYFNYKGRFSIILLAVCDANYRFLFLDIGDSGRHSDGGVLANSAFGKALLHNKLPLPPANTIADSVYTLPYCFVSDAAFPLKNNMLRPYPGTNLPEDEAVFNYRLSRARRVIENAFGILVSRWRIFKKPIIAKVEKVILITQTACCLHNYLQKQPSETRTNLADRKVNGEIMEGSWRSEEPGTNMTHLRSTGQTFSNNHSEEATAIRNEFKQYFNSASGSLEWQLRVVHRR